MEFFLTVHIENQNFETIPDETHGQTSRQKPFLKSQKQRQQKTEHNMIKDPKANNLRQSINELFWPLYWLLIKGNT